MTGRRTKLAVAVASGVMAYVYLVDEDLKDWGSWRSQTADHGKARSLIRDLIARYEPETVVTEDPDRDCAKAGDALKLLQVIAQDARDQAGHHVRIVRNQSDQTKHDEAKSLAARFPAFAPMLPEEPKLFVREERRMILFEALSLAVAADGPPTAAPPDEAA